MIKNKERLFVELLTMSSDKFNTLLHDWQTSYRKKNNSKLYIFGPSFIHYRTNKFSTQKNQFPAISVTGKACALNCAHCGRKKLSSMISATNAEELFKLAKQLANDGSKGFLLSGGCTSSGSVDFQEVLPAIKKIKKELDLDIFVHTGLISRQMALQLKEV